MEAATTTCGGGPMSVASPAGQRAGSGGERFYPGNLPALLGAFLDGQDIDEPFELWS